MQTIYGPYKSLSRIEDTRIPLPQMSSEQDANEKYVEKSKPSSPQKTERSHPKSAVSEQGKKIKKDLDKIMDEIDDVLEENAEEFIRSYVQRGGE